MDKKLPNKCYLSKVEIENFWGEEDISMDFNDDVNFIIGRNGAGKTTLINTIAAVLEGNYEFLSKLQFSKITITLSEANSPKKPVIEVEKGKKTSDEIIYTIKSKKSELSKDTIKIGFDGNIQYLIEDEEGNEKGKKRSSEDKDGIRNSSKHRMLMRRKNRFFTLREYHNLFKDNLFQLYDLCWLTIHRSPSRSSGRDKDYDSTVDQKLDELSTKCTKYFSKLSNSAAVEKEDFQKQLFLSLTKIYTEGKQLRALARVSEYKDERKDLETIYENFQIPEDDYKKT